MLDRWAYENGVTRDFSRPGKPTDKVFIESFNGSFLDEYLNVNGFLSLDDAMEKIQAFKDLHNALKPFLRRKAAKYAELNRKEWPDRNSATLAFYSPKLTETNGYRAGSGRSFCA